MKKSIDIINKFPRTQHIQGSRLQAGDEDLLQVPFASIANRHLVVEEKIDGANCAISFTSDGELLLQSRGHYLVGGAREKHFDLFKLWTSTNKAGLWNALGDQYVMYGEWMYAKHTVFYNALPHYFMEFDVLDKTTMSYLDTPSRGILLAGLPICSVPVLYTGKLETLEGLTSLLGDSLYITSTAEDDLVSICKDRNQDVEKVMKETSLTRAMEGLYIKVEDEATGLLVERYKFVRASFHQAIADSEGHWLDRAIIPNQLADGVDIFAM